jgi:hypothetical protein
MRHSGHPYRMLIPRQDLIRSVKKRFPWVTRVSRVPERSGHEAARGTGLQSTVHSVESGHLVKERACVTAT